MDSSQIRRHQSRRRRPSASGSEIVLSQPSNERVAVVVSAMSGVTNALIEAIDRAATHDDSYLSKLEAVEKLHLDTIAALELGAARSSSLSDIVVSDFNAIKEVLRGVWITRLASERIVEFISGHGELWSAQLLHAYLESRPSRKLARCTQGPRR